MNKDSKIEIENFLDWLYREVFKGLSEVNGKNILSNYLGDYQKNELELKFGNFLDVLKKNQGKIKTDLSDRKFQERLKKEYEKSLAKLLPIKEKMAKTDWLIDQIVYKLYDLTDEEIAIVEAK